MAAEEVLLAAWLALGLVAVLALAATGPWSAEAPNPSLIVARALSGPAPAAAFVSVPLILVWVLAAPVALWRLERRRLDVR
ncbi:MAG: hypothetical protein ACYDBQ_12415 [Thermoplasmatota archaeon]